MVLPIADENEPGRGLPYVTLALIAANILVFVLLQQLTAENPFTYGFSAIPLEITTSTDLVQPIPVTIQGQSYLLLEAPGPSPIQLTLLSSMFMHANLLHIGGNMLFLWIFGDNVEHRIGRVSYLLAYLAAGLVGSLAQILSSPESVIPSLGASGAISGVLGAYIVLFPRNGVTAILLRILVQVPAVVAIGLWFAFQVLSSIGTDPAQGGVAYLAHIGGFAVGVVVGFVFRLMPPARSSRQAWP